MRRRVLRRQSMHAVRVPRKWGHGLTSCELSQSIGRGRSRLQMFCLALVTSPDPATTGLMALAFTGFGHRSKATLRRRRSRVNLRVLNPVNRGRAQGMANRAQVAPAATRRSTVAD